MILTLLLLSILTALFVNGLDIATSEGMILHFVRKWLDSVLIFRSVHHSVSVTTIYKPILYCIRCMPSIYGTIICLCALPFGFDLIWQVPVVVISAVCLATVINSQYL